MVPRATHVLHSGGKAYELEISPDGGPAEVERSIQLERSRLAESEQVWTVITRYRITGPGIEELWAFISRDLRGRTPTRSGHVKLGGTIASVTVSDLLRQAHAILVRHS